MADTEAARPTTNGSNGDGGGDSDDEQVPRPVNIEQDVREMERRKRVDAIMSSKLFREELEKVVSDSIRSEGVLAPGAGLDGGLSNMISDAMSIRGRGGVCVAPINDIRGLEGMSYTKNEKALRCRLAAAYRLADLHGWTQGINNHISLRISQDTEHFLINPFGTLYSEVTASSLIKVDMQGNVVEAGTTNYGVNVQGFMMHSAVHANRPDLKCVLHLRHPPVTSVSSLKCGLMPLTQESCLVGKVSYHENFGPEVDADKVQRDLGVHNKVMMLRNGGALCCGETVEEAFFYAKNLVAACEAQLKMMPLGLDNLVTIDDEAFAKTFNAGQRGHSEEGGKQAQARHWGIGEMEFEASMRILDNSGYRTGHTYRHPLVKEEPAKPKSDVELPPAVSSLGYLLEEENLYKDGPLRALLSAYTKQQAKGVPRAKWVNSPNVYQKVEVLETGTPDPKTITKWVADGSPSKNTPIRVESANQFVPLGTNKKEFKKIQAAMKQVRPLGRVTAGPESKILEGGSVLEERVAGDGEASRPYSAAGDGRDMPYEYKVGAASKGIIQRDFQHHATVFRSAYAKNPFDNVTDDELREYQRVVDAKSRNENPYPVSPTLDSTGEADQATVSGAGAVTSPTDDTEADGTPQIPSSTATGASPATTEPATPTRNSATRHTLPRAAAAPKIIGDHTYNGDDTDGARTFSDGEGDTTQATDPDSSVMSPTKKEKKKRSGLRTPSFLKKKSKDKKKAKEKA